MKKESTHAAGPGWHARRRKDQPWFWWVKVISPNLDTSGWADIPGVGFDGTRKEWAMPEEVLDMLLLQEGP